MKKSLGLSTLVALTIIRLGSMLLPAAEGERNDLPAVRPQWVPGDEWFVQCMNTPEERAIPPISRKYYTPIDKTKPWDSVYRFVVVRMTDMEGTRCYEVLLRFMTAHHSPRETWSHRLLFFREDDLALIRIERYDHSKEPAATQRFRKWPCFPVALEGLLPLCWPAFDKSGAPATEIEPPNAGGPSQEANVIQEPGMGLGRVEVALSERRPINVVDSETVMEWAEGKPWWVTAQQTLQGQLKTRCRLLSWREFWHIVRTRADEDEMFGIAAYMRPRADEIEPEGLPPVRPPWAPGDEWFVQCTTTVQERPIPPLGEDHRPVRQGNHIYWFCVVRMASIDGVRCYEVLLRLMTAGGSPVQARSHWLLFFREDDLALIRIERYDHSKEPAAAQRFDTWPCFPLELQGVLPLCWPAFDKSGAPAREIEPPNAGGPSQEANVVQEPGIGHRCVQVVLSQARNEPPRRQETVQEWAEGKPWWKPWWVTARQTIGGELKCECKLVSWRDFWHIVIADAEENTSPPGW